MTTTKKWIKQDLCEVCEHVLTDVEVHHSGGTCPYCGHYSGRVFVDTKLRPKIVQEITTCEWIWYPPFYKITITYEEKQ